MQNDNLLHTINNPAATQTERIAALRELRPQLVRDNASPYETNNHIHTIYSFSPYTPAMAAYKAWEAGLVVAGSVDHDSYQAANEMRDACDALGLGCVTGFEVRVSFADTPFADRKINNPDLPGNVYMTAQGIRREHFDTVQKFLAPIRAARIARTRRMYDNAVATLARADIATHGFEHDVLAKSKASEGGGVTERHLLAGIADNIIRSGSAALNGESGLSTFIEKRLGVRVPANLAARLDDAHNPFLLYDLLGVLKSSFLDALYEAPGADECPPAQRVIDFAHSIGAIPAYAYLGDVAESPTGDKKAEKFEDDFLDALFDTLKAMNYSAVAYMPPRNTLAQLERVRRLCHAHGFMEISGVDINSPRQSFNCPELARPEFRHLVDTTWELVRMER